jgi:hypothetical protein
MSNNPMTETQGQQVIDLLENVVDALRDVLSELQYIRSSAGYLDRLEQIEEGINSANVNLSGIASDVSSIESNR